MRVAIRALAILFQRLKAFLWDVICLAYVFIWGIKSPMRQALTTSAGIVLLTSSLVFFAEVIALFHEELLTHSALQSVTSGESASPFLAWLQQGTAYVNSMPWIEAIFKFLKHLLWVKIAILLFGAWMVRHRWKEMRQHQRASVFAGSMRELFEDMAMAKIKPIEGATPEVNERTNIEKVLIAFCSVFSPKARIQLNIMRPLNSDGNSLEITQQWPKHDKYEPNFQLAKGKGGAGTAFTENAPVYIPAIRFEYGIVLSRIVKENRDGKQIYSLKKADELTSRVYVQTKKQPFRSIISLPIRKTDEPETVLAILNLDSAKQNAFGSFEQEVALAAASAIAAVFTDAEMAARTAPKS